MNQKMHKNKMDQYQNSQNSLLSDSPLFTILSLFGLLDASFGLCQASVWFIECQILSQAFLTSCSVISLQFEVNNVGDTLMGQN